MAGALPTSYFTIKYFPNRLTYFFVTLDMPIRRNRTVDSDEDDDDDVASQSQATTVVGEDEPPQKKSKTESSVVAAFNKRYKVVSRTNEEVLGECSCLFWRFRSADGHAGSIAEQSKQWTSAHYAHFKTPEIFLDKGVVKYQFICKRCVHSAMSPLDLRLTPLRSHPSIKIVRARHDTSTSNLKNHALKCAPPKEGTIEEHVPGAKYSKALMRFKLTRWIARRNRPYAIVDDDELQDIFRMLYARVEVPSARTISRDVQEIFRDVETECY